LSFKIQLSRSWPELDYGNPLLFIPSCGDPGWGIRKKMEKIGQVSEEVSEE